MQHFYDSPNYAKSHVSAHRSISNLISKGFVHTWYADGEGSLQIGLTSDGIKKAAELLGISECYVPVIPKVKNEALHPATYKRYKKAGSAEEWISLLRCHAQGIVYECDGIDFGCGKVHIVCGLLEMGRGADQLCAIISARLKMNPFSGDVYAFCGRERDQIRYIHWDGSGFKMTARRREYGRYIWPHPNLGAIITIDAKDFDFILRGQRQRNNPNYL